MDDVTGWGCGSNASSSLLPSNLRCISLGLEMLGRSQDWSGYHKKTGPLTWRGSEGM